MIGPDFIADTNILIYLLEGRNETRAFTQYAIGISELTEIELLGKFQISKEEINKIKALISDCYLVSISQQIKEEAIHLKQSQKLKLPDALIAATAICSGLPLLTADKGFEKIKNLDVLLLNL